MSVRARIILTIVVLLHAYAGVAADGDSISQPRLLTASDIGKVFVKIDEEPHPNFGHYLLLKSVDELYGFDSFDLVKGKPIGKLHVSYFAYPLFREVAISPETVKLVAESIRKANEAHAKSLEEWRRSLERDGAERPPNTSFERTRER